MIPHQMQYSIFFLIFSCWRALLKDGAVPKPTARRGRFAFCRPSLEGAEHGSRPSETPEVSVQQHGSGSDGTQRAEGDSRRKYVLLFHYSANNATLNTTLKTSTEFTHGRGKGRHRCALLFNVIYDTSSWSTSWSPSASFLVIVERYFVLILVNLLYHYNTITLLYYILLPAGVKRRWTEETGCHCDNNSS